MKFFSEHEAIPEVLSLYYAASENKNWTGKGHSPLVFALCHGPSFIIIPNSAYDNTSFM